MAMSQGQSSNAVMVCCVGGSSSNGVRCVGGTSSNEVCCVGGSSSNGVRCVGGTSSNGVRYVGGSSSNGVRCVGGSSSNGVGCVGGSSSNGVPRENLTSSSQSEAVKEKRVEGSLDNNSVEVPETNNNHGADNTNSNDVEDTNNSNEASGQHQNEQPQNPPSTLVQTVGNRSFKVTRMMVAQQMMLVLSFPRGLTLLTPDSDPNQVTQDGVAHPNQVTNNGVAQLDVHRKFLPSFNKYLHWISFTFTTGLKVQAQIMLPTRLSAACQLVEGGASACFLHCPFRIQRRPQIPTRRRRINGRK